MAQLLYVYDGSDKESAYQCKKHKKHGFNPSDRKSPWRRAWQTTSVFLPEEFHGLRSLVNPMDTGAWQTTDHGVEKSWTQLKDAKAETPVLWPPHKKSWLIGNDSDAGRDWGQEEKGMTEDEMAGWHHWLDGCEFEWTGRPGMLQFMGSQRVGHNWVTELNWTELKQFNKHRCPHPVVMGLSINEFGCLLKESKVIKYVYGI